MGLKLSSFQEVSLSTQSKHISFHHNCSHEHLSPFLLNSLLSLGMLDIEGGYRKLESKAKRKHSLRTLQRGQKWLLCGAANTMAKTLPLARGPRSRSFTVPRGQASVLVLNAHRVGECLKRFISAFGKGTGEGGWVCLTQRVPF